MDSCKAGFGDLPVAIEISVRALALTKEEVLCP